MPAVDVLAVALGYLSGSVPFAYLLSRRRGIDLRRVGSGNVGASNVLRTSGVRNAVAAMCLDAVKGSAAVFLAGLLTSAPAVAVAARAATVRVLRSRIGPEANDTAGPQGEGEVNGGETRARANLEA